MVARYPKKVMDVLRGWLASNGAEILTGQVDHVDPTSDGAAVTADLVLLLGPAMWRSIVT
jgi:hypothetical protein